ncbi:MAG: hypothetical protein IJI68_04985 [Eggerthellaceae bacterium]|nr:hypothetical protein [Eggerthellaceae bacterium]
MANNILVNINRCTGCWTCSMSCKMQYKLEPETFRQFVRTIGGGEIDQPGGEWPNLYLKWMPIWKQSCIGCRGEAATDFKPYCVYNCPAGALTYGDFDDPDSEASKREAQLKQKGFRVYEMPVWEDTRPGIRYAENSI